MSIQTSQFSFSADINRENPNVMVVDDNRLLLSAMIRWLKREMGWGCLCFADAHEALDFMDTHTLPIDIMIADLKMPGMNGIDFLDEAQKRDDEVIQILMTGHEHYDIIVEAINRLDLYFFMEKPWDPSQFALVLNNAWSKKKLSVRLEQRMDAFEHQFHQLKAAKIDVLRHKNQAVIGEMLQGICHNLNTPLNAILGHIELIQMRLAQAKGGVVEVEKLDSSVQLVHEAGVRLGQVISNLMIKSRMEQTPKRQSISMERMIRQEMAFLQADHFLKHDVDVVVDIVPDIPNIWINYADFSQIFGNIVHNAIDAIREVSKPSLEIKSYYVEAEQAVVLEIHDNGAGVPDDIKKDIFVPFFTTKKPIEELEHAEYSNEREELGSYGVGLGLHSVIQLLEPYEGKIDVETSHLGGACFRVRFPLNLDEYQKIF